MAPQNAIRADVSAPSATETHTARTVDTSRAELVQQGKNLVWWVRWRRATWAARTSTKSKLFADRRPAAALAHRLVSEGFRVELLWARRGVWNPASIETAEKDETPACAACAGTGVFLPENPDLARPCPACAGLSA